jgi:FxsC-like protein
VVSEPWFFFSYARGDGDAFLDDFYKELVKEVFSLAKIKDPEGIGFRDSRSIELGQHWVTEIGAALQHAKVMVCVYSPKYFESEWCGREWTAFQARVDEIANPPTAAALIIPVLWVPTEIPAVGNVGQWTNDSLGESYTKSGLRKLTKRKGEEFTRAVEVIAAAIHRGVERALPSAAKMPDYTQTANAFATAAPQSKRSGPRVVKFVVAAGQAQEVEPVRGSAENYGETAMDWMPYAPSSDRPIDALLQHIASGKELRLRSELKTLEDDLDKLLSEAEANNSVLILAIDPWSVLIKRYRDALRAYDQRLSLNSATVLPWNMDDPKTRQELARLEQAVTASLARQSTLNAASVHTRVTSEPDLEKLVQEAILRAHTRIAQFREVQSRAEADIAVRKPQISATSPER